MSEQEFTEVPAYEMWGPRAVEAYVNDYARTGNALCAWFAYAMARRHGVAIPPLILQYLDRVAARLYDLGSAPVAAIERQRQENALDRYRQKIGLAPRRRRLPRPPKDPAPAIAKALEMDRKGRGSVFERLRRQALEEHMAWEVANRLIDLGYDESKAYLACDDLAKDFGISSRTLRRAWKKHGARAMADMRRVKAQIVALGLDRGPTLKEVEEWELNEARRQNGLLPPRERRPPREET